MKCDVCGCGRVNNKYILIQEEKGGQREHQRYFTCGTCCMSAAARRPFHHAADVWAWLLLLGSRTRDELWIQPGPCLQLILRRPCLAKISQSGETYAISV